MIMSKASDVMDSLSEMRAKGEPFALATVVRTVAATAVKAGAKAVIRPTARCPRAGSAGAARGRRC
jgi:xanthine/CO dehydrogenase XdhC/CoxF family maturation factor